MLAVKGYYENGRIELIEPIPEFVSEAELHIIIVPKDGSLHPPSDDDFKVIGLSNFFETEDDKDVDWDKYFQHA